MNSLDAFLSFFLFLILCVVLLVVSNIGMEIKQKDLTQHCLTYHKTLSYEQALSTCDAILNGKETK